MPTYILLSTLTQQGVQTLKSNPDRLRQVNHDIEELGARILHQWATLGPTIPTDGSYSEPLWITNSGVGQTGTLTIGDSNTTLSGTMTIATNTTRKFLLNVTGPNTITIYNQGSLSL